MIIKKCSIIYGYTDDCLDNLDLQDSPVLIIEPRSEYIDKVKSLVKSKSVMTLISKVLVEESGFKEVSFYHNKEENIYWIEKDVLSIKGINLFNIKKYMSYTITMESIILQFQIQNITNFVVNMNVKNVVDIVNSLSKYNHIVSNIYVLSEMGRSCKTLDFYNKTVLDNGTIKYVHKNLNINLPNIGLYFLNESVNTNDDHLALLISQYKMNLIITDEEQNDTKIIVPYPESVQIIKRKPLENLKISKLHHENVTNTLNSIFNSSLSMDNMDIIIQYNPKYFTTNKTLQIMYPLKDNTIYVNKLYDIMYATKNCMYMLYQIIMSKYFTDYIDSKRQEKGGLFKIFAKRYFYDYLSKIFVFKEF